MAAVTGDAQAAPLLVLATVAPATTAYVPVLVALVNPDGTELRMLRTHDPLPVFYAFDLVRADGTPLQIVGAGKADFGEHDLEFIVLRPGELIGFEVDIAALLCSPRELRPGRYRLAAEYHNQYGEHCFVGSVRSATIDLDVAEAAGDHSY